MSIYLSRNNQRFGPYEESTIQEMLQAGTCSANDPAICEGMTEWQPLSRLLGFQAPPPVNLPTGRLANERRSSMGEAKIFESEGFVVTTERFFYGSKVISLADIEGRAGTFIDENFTGTGCIGCIGLLPLIFGGILVLSALSGGYFSWAFIGLIVTIIGASILVGAYYFFRLVSDREVLMTVNGERLNIKVNTTELANNLADSINKGIDELLRAKIARIEDKTARVNAIQEEISKLSNYLKTGIDDSEFERVKARVDELRAEFLSLKEQNQ